MPAFASRWGHPTSPAPPKLNKVYTEILIRIGLPWEECEDRGTNQTLADPVAWSFKPSFFCFNTVLLHLRRKKQEKGVDRPYLVFKGYDVFLEVYKPRLFSILKLAFKNSSFRGWISDTDLILKRIFLGLETTKKSANICNLQPGHKCFKHSCLPAAPNKSCSPMNGTSAPLPGGAGIGFTCQSVLEHSSDDIYTCPQLMMYVVDMT